MNGPSPFDPAPEYEYALVDLGTVGGNYSWAYGINNNEQIVGLSTTSGVYQDRPRTFEAILENLAALNTQGLLPDLDSALGCED
jgi:uncharacterized membrane protein